MRVHGQLFARLYPRTPVLAAARVVRAGAEHCIFSAFDLDGKDECISGERDKGWTAVRTDTHNAEQDLTEAEMDRTYVQEYDDIRNKVLAARPDKDERDSARS
jgi:hypothetical protein